MAVKALILLLFNMRIRLKTTTSNRFQAHNSFWFGNKEMQDDKECEGPIPVGIYLLKVNNGNTRTRCEICSHLTIRHQNDANSVLLVSLLLTLNIFHTLF